ncbi:inverted formin-2 [Plakobranchus ocellatus]|uniref:Inverted formin-2 n=1 Tax=Plakobranchus ocellatus TaxID=259542 RepID=A0AAV3ZRL0_9GAST|nr:inverted formin-2 [Plakobranchus ocellatus]
MLIHLPPATIDIRAVIVCRQSLPQQSRPQTQSATSFPGQTSKRKKYRFSCILDEIRSGESVPYQTNLLEFINCLIIYADGVDERVKVRNEFYGKSGSGSESGVNSMVIQGQGQE